MTYNEVCKMRKSAKFTLNPKVLYRLVRKHYKGVASPTTKNIARTFRWTIPAGLAIGGGSLLFGGKDPDAFQETAPDKDRMMSTAVRDAQYYRQLYLTNFNNQTGRQAKAKLDKLVLPNQWGFVDYNRPMQLADAIIDHQYRQRAKAYNKRKAEHYESLGYTKNDTGLDYLYNLYNKMKRRSRATGENIGRYIYKDPADPNNRGWL